MVNYGRVNRPNYHYHKPIEVGKILYNLNPVNIILGKHQDDICPCSRSDKYTLVEKVADGIANGVNSVAKGVGSLFEHNPTTKTISKKDINPTVVNPKKTEPVNVEPLGELPVPAPPSKPVEPKPVEPTLPQPPVPIGKEAEELTNYTNTTNKHEGFFYGKNKAGEYQMDIKENNLPEQITKSAFDLMHNDDSSIELKYKNFGQMFNDLKPTNKQNGNPITEAEFMRFHESYTKNASGVLGKNNKDIRKETKIIDMDEVDKKHLKTLFETMAGEDRLLTKKEYIDFNTQMFNKYASGKDGQDTILTRAEQDKFISEWAASKNK